MLIVRASTDVHAQIESLLKELDRPVDSDESPIRFYKLKNANAIEVLYSLLALQQATGSGQVNQAGGLGAGAFGTLGGLKWAASSRWARDFGVPGLSSRHVRWRFPG